MIKCKNDGSSYGIQGALRVRSVVLFQASYHRGHPALMELHGKLGRRHLTFWSSAQAISTISGFALPSVIHNNQRLNFRHHLVRYYWYHTERPEICNTRERKQ